MEWKASKARLRLQFIKQGFAVRSPMNLPTYFFMFLKTLWERWPSSLSLSSSSSLSSSLSSTTGESLETGSDSVDEDVPLNAAEAAKGGEKVGAAGEQEKAERKRQIQDKIHRRYMNWVKKPRGDID